MLPQDEFQEKHFHVSRFQLILILTTELFQFDKRQSKYSYYFVKTIGENGHEREIPLF